MGHFASECRSKSNINSVEEKKPECMYYIDLDKSVPPVVQPSRKIPYNLSQKLLEKLIELEENDIIEKVEGSTTWVSPLVIVPKRDSDIRIIVGC